MVIKMEKRFNNCLTIEQVIAVESQITNLIKFNNFDDWYEFYINENCLFIRGKQYFIKFNLYKWIPELQEKEKINLQNPKIKRFYESIYAIFNYIYKKIKGKRFIFCSNRDQINYFEKLLGD